MTITPKPTAMFGIAAMLALAAGAHAQTYDQWELKLIEGQGGSHDVAQLEFRQGQEYRSLDGEEGERMQFQCTDSPGPLRTVREREAVQPLQPLQVSMTVAVRLAPGAAVSRLETDRLTVMQAAGRLYRADRRGYRKGSVVVRVGEGSHVTASIVAHGFIEEWDEFVAACRGFVEGEATP